MGIDGNVGYQGQGGYGKYLPDIDVNDGVARLMNNMKIYISVLKKFDGAKLVEDVLTAAGEADYEKLRHAAHTLKGAAGNLSLKRFQEVSSAIEQCAKDKADPGELLAELQAVQETTSKAVESLIAENT